MEVCGGFDALELYVGNVGKYIKIILFIKAIRSALTIISNKGNIFFSMHMYTLLGVLVLI